MDEVGEYRYRAGLTSVPVYAFSESYFCATRKNEKPAKDRDGLMEWEWSKVAESENGFIVWESINNNTTT